MKYLAAILLLLPFAPAVCANAQATDTASQTLSLDIEAGFSAVRANSAPGQCGCFFMYGEQLQIAVVAPNHLEFVSDFSRTKVTNINGQYHNINLQTYMEGVRYDRPVGRRLTPFAEAFVGFGHTSSNYTIESNVLQLAVAGGGGVNLQVLSHFDVRLAEVDYVYTQIPNAVNGRQNQLRVGAGLVYHFTGR